MPKLVLMFDVSDLEEYGVGCGGDDRATPGQRDRDRQSGGVGPSRARRARRRQLHHRGSAKHQRHVRQRPTGDATRAAAQRRSTRGQAFCSCSIRTQSSGPRFPTPVLESLGDTVYLDTKQHRALRATLESARADAAKSVNARPVFTRDHPAPRRSRRPSSGRRTRRTRRVRSGVPIRR